MDAIVHPTDRLRYEAAWSEALHSGAELECEVRLRRHDGAYRWFLTQATPVHARNQRVISWFGSTTDIHERKLLEEELEHSRILLEESQMSAHVGSWAWDILNDSVTWSDELYRLYGVDPQSADLSIASFMEFVHPDDQQRVQENVQASLESGEPFQFEHRIVRPDGEIRTLEARGRAVQGEIGDVVAMIGSGQDVTERKRLERLQQEFIAMAAHELKTPLTALRGYAQLLQRGRDHGRALEMIVEQSRHLARLVDDLLEASHLDAGRLELRLAPVEIVALARRCVENAAELSGSHVIELETSAPEIVGAWDSDRIEQIIQNLLSNAIKYSPDGGRVLVSLAETDSTASLRVSDSGLGIAPDLIPHIFDRFYRVHESALSTKGLGLGLYITRSFVEAHGGTISVESGGGVSGTTFTVILPREGGAETSAPSLLQSSLVGHWHDRAIGSGDGQACPPDRVSIPGLSIMTTGVARGLVPCAWNQITRTRKPGFVAASMTISRALVRTRHRGRAPVHPDGQLMVITMTTDPLVI